MLRVLVAATRPPAGRRGKKEKGGGPELVKKRETKRFW